MIRPFHVILARMYYLLGKQITPLKQPVWAVSRRRGVFAHSICIPPPIPPSFCTRSLSSSGWSSCHFANCCRRNCQHKKTVNVIPILTLLLLDWSRGRGQIERRDHNSFVGGNLPALSDATDNTSEERILCALTRANSAAISLWCCHRPCARITFAKTNIKCFNVHMFWQIGNGRRGLNQN